jgi:predicted alpha/beta-hydrolase family hydrolase
MGSSGSKSRKTKKKPQHLQKVGTHAGSEADMHRERQGAMDAMGVGGLSPGVRTAIMVVVGLAFIGAIVGLLILNAVY